MCDLMCPCNNMGTIRHPLHVILRCPSVSLCVRMCDLICSRNSGLGLMSTYGASDRQAYMARQAGRHTHPRAHGYIKKKNRSTDGYHTYYVYYLVWGTCGENRVYTYILCLLFRVGILLRFPAARMAYIHTYIYLYHTYIHVPLLHILFRVGNLLRFPAARMEYTYVHIPLLHIRTYTFTTHTIQSGEPVALSCGENGVYTYAHIPLLHICAYTFTTHTYILCILFRVGNLLRFPVALYDMNGVYTYIHIHIHTYTRTYIYT